MDGEEIGEMLSFLGAGSPSLEKWRGLGGGSKVGQKTSEMMGRGIARLELSEDSFPRVNPPPFFLSGKWGRELIFSMMICSNTMIK
jgi:hypothetical protein